jgi:hypothetical protein
MDSLPYFDWEKSRAAHQVRDGRLNKHVLISYMAADCRFFRRLAFNICMFGNQNLLASHSALGKTPEP